jgi:hypothetical protein
LQVRVKVDAPSQTKAESKPKQYRLGVLLVHGIGTQPSGDALVRWGDVLLKTIRSATRNRVRVEVGPAGRGEDTGQGDPASAVVWLGPHNGEKPWLLVDGWWADAFLPPSYRELVSWSVRALPWAIAVHIAQRFWQTARHNNTWAKAAATALAIVQLLAGLAIAPLFVLFLALTLPLGLLPIPQLRSLIFAAQGALVSTMGDSLAFVESPVRAALIRTRVLHRLTWLKARCERTMIVAHSQGAAVVLDALGAIRESANEEPLWLSGDPSLADLAPDILVTFGAGTNQLTSLKRLAKGLPEKMGGNPVIYAIGALLAFGGIVGWLSIAALLHRTTLAKIFFAGAAFLVFTALFGGVVWAASKLIAWIGDRWTLVKRHQRGVTVSALTVLNFALLIPLIVLADKKEFPILPTCFIFLSAIGLIGGISRILSKEMKAAVTMVITPPKLSRWLDLYASADPVPNGPTRGVESVSTEIWNRGSFVADHTAYWENLDGFVLPVVRACAETAGSAWQAELPPESLDLDQRAKWRVGWLRLTRNAVWLGWLVIAVSVWSRHGNEIPIPFKMPRWLPAGAADAARLAIFAALIAILAWVSLAIPQFIWGMWVRSERKALLAHQPPQGNAFYPVLGLVIVVWVIFALMRIALQDELILLTKPGEFGDAWAALLGFALISTWFLLWLRPAPKPNDPL